METPEAGKPAPKPAVQQFTIDEEINEIGREIVMRRGFYAKKVIAHQMTQSDADYKINVMVSAQNRLKALKFLMSNLQNPY